MNILLTNDDGIDAKGLTALESAVRKAFSPENLWVVAPDRGRSQCSHATTANAPIETVQHGANRFATTGYPADCVRIAIYGLGFKPDWVFSGINHGGNLGHDIVLSGTVAAAREAAYHGIAAAAVSHYINQGAVDWELAANRASAALLDITPRDRHDGFWNINLPHPDPADAHSSKLAHCLPGRAPLPAGYKAAAQHSATQAFHAVGSYQDRIQDPESDVEVCFGGDISISHIKI